MPNDTTMESQTFGIIEDRISPKIQAVAANLLTNNLIEEVRLSMEASGVQDTGDFFLWQHVLNNNNNNFVLPQAKYARISCSFDMGWQQQRSGNRYNLQSGHALLVGRRTQKPICMIIKSKRCNYCTLWRRKNLDLVTDDDIKPPEQKYCSQCRQRT